MKTLQDKKNTTETALLKLDAVEEPHAKRVRGVNKRQRLKNVVLKYKKKDDVTLFISEYCM